MVSWSSASRTSSSATIVPSLVAVIRGDALKAIPVRVAVSVVVKVICVSLFAAKTV